MKVKAVKTFVAGRYGRRVKGAVFELPEDVNWLQTGYVVPVKDSGAENATIEAPEAAVVKTKPRTKRTKG